MPNTRYRTRVGHATSGDGEVLGSSSAMGVLLSLYTLSEYSIRLSLVKYGTT